MSKNIISDSEILGIVSRAIEQANNSGDNWADFVQSDLTAAGVNLADEQPDGSDAWEIVRLEDGRTVRLSDESATGAARYRITEQD